MEVFGICSLVLQIALGILNTVVLVVGLLTAAVGGIFLGLASNMAVPVILQGILFTILSTLNVVDRTTLNNIEATNWTDLLQPAGIALVVVGGVIAIIGGFGYFGLSSKIALKIYTILVIILVVVESIAVGLFFSGVFNSQLRSTANSTLVDYYVDIYDAGIYSMIWNVVMIKMSCCGLDSFEDFHYTLHPYPKSDTIKVGGEIMSVTLATPLTCCKTNGSYPSILFTDELCAVNPSSNNSNWYTGCWSEVYAVVTQPAVIAICSLIIIAQSAIAAVAGIIAHQSDRPKF